jgi:pilus assembly protein CpaE
MATLTAMLTVAILSSDLEQRELLCRLVDATAVARTVVGLPDFTAGGSAIARQIQDLKPEVIIVDIPPRDISEPLHLIEFLHHQFPQISMFAVGEMTRRQTIVDAMRSGACEFLERPPSTNNLIEAFNRVSAKWKTVRDKDRGKVVVVVNAKGGCGATTVSVNLAVALNEEHGPTAVVDLAHIGHVALHLNARPGFTISDAWQNSQRLDPALLKGFMSRSESGVHLLAGSELPAPDSPTPDQVARLFDLLSMQFKFVVVDASSRLDPVVRTVCEFADHVLMVAETDMVALLWNAARVQNYLGEHAIHDKLSLVLNRFHKTPEFSEADAEAATDARILWKIPSQYFAVGSAIDRGTPVVLQKNSEVGRSFKGLAAALLNPRQMPTRNPQRKPQPLNSPKLTILR